MNWNLCYLSIYAVYLSIYRSIYLSIYGTAKPFHLQNISLPNDQAMSRSKTHRANLKNDTNCLVILKKQEMELANHFLEKIHWNTIIVGSLALPLWAQCFMQHDVMSKALGYWKEAILLGHRCWYLEGTEGEYLKREFKSPPPERIHRYWRCQSSHNGIKVTFCNGG